MTPSVLPVTSEAPIKPGVESGTGLRVLYLYSGKSRRVNLRSCLQKLCNANDIKLHMDEIDYNESGAEHDLSEDAVWLKIKCKLTPVCLYDIIIMTPPCSTWTRLRHANWRGPALAP